MKIGNAFISFIAVLLIAFTASAQALPAWKIGEICKGESDRAACAEFESRAKRLVVGPWPTLPPQVKSACLEQLSREQAESYRLLRDCIEAEVGEVYRSAQRKRISE